MKKSIPLNQITYKRCKKCGYWYRTDYSQKMCGCPKSEKPKKQINKYRVKYRVPAEDDRWHESLVTTSLEKAIQIRDSLLPRCGCECVCHLEIYIPNYSDKRRGGMWFTFNIDDKPYICTCGRMWRFPIHTKPGATTGYLLEDKQQVEVKNERNA